MKNLEKVFMVLAFLCSFGDLILAIYKHTSWAWQFIAMVWIYIAFLKTTENEKLKH
jgi:hypothetical protein